VISPTQRPLPDNTEHSQKTDIHALARIRTHNSSKRAAADGRLRPPGHRNLMIIMMMITTTNTVVQRQYENRFHWRVPTRQSRLLNYMTFLKYKFVRTTFPKHEFQNTKCAGQESCTIGNIIYKSPLPQNLLLNPVTCQRPCQGHYTCSR
jgi:hypothetical protein